MDNELKKIEKYIKENDPLKMAFYYDNGDLVFVTKTEEELLELSKEHFKYWDNIDDGDNSKLEKDYSALFKKLGLDFEIEPIETFYDIVFQEIYSGNDDVYSMTAEQQQELYEKIKNYEKQIKKDPSDKKLILEAIKTCAYVLYFISDDLKNDKEFVKEIVKTSPMGLIFLDPKFQNDKEIALEAVKVDGNALGILNEVLKNDKDVVITALKNSETAFQFVSNELKKDKKFIEEIEKEGLDITKMEKQLQVGMDFFNMMFNNLTLEEKINLAEDGDMEMASVLAEAYIHGNDEVEPDLKKAFYWYEKLAENGNSISQYNLGLFYLKGNVVKRDFEKAYYWMKKASENGDQDALKNLEKYEKLAKNVEKLEHEDAEIQSLLAGMLMELGVTFGDGDYEECLDLAKKSAEQGNCDAMWTLGLAYEHGRGVKVDLKKAFEYYEKGANLNHAPSQNNLALFYFKGNIVKQDFEKAFELIKKSAENGYGVAFYNLARCYEFGNGTEIDFLKAIEWYKKSFELNKNDFEIARTIAKCYMNLFDEDNSKINDIVYWFDVSAKLSGDLSEFELFSKMKDNLEKGLPNKKTTFNECFSYTLEHL